MTKTIKIVTDSTADVPAELVARHGIGVIPAILEIEGQTYYDNVTLSRADFYRDLHGYKTFPKTAAASAGTFADLFRATTRLPARKAVRSFRFTCRPNSAA